MFQFNVPHFGETEKIKWHAQAILKSIIVANEQLPYYLEDATLQMAVFKNVIDPQMELNVSQSERKWSQCTGDEGLLLFTFVVIKLLAFNL